MDVRYEHDAWCAGLVHTDAERRRFSVSDSPSSSLAMWKQSVMASVVREKSSDRPRSELNISPGERFYFAYLVFQSTSTTVGPWCVDGRPRPKRFTGHLTTLALSSTVGCGARK